MESRRKFVSRFSGLALMMGASRRFLEAAEPSRFQFRYMLASSMYGKLPLEVILPEVAKVGAEWIDIWPQVHGNQREQMDAIGLDAFDALLNEHEIRLGCLTHYDLGPFGLAPAFETAQRFACPVIVTGGRGPRDLSGSELRSAVKTFCEQMTPHLDQAGERGVNIAIENHANNLIHTPDSLKWLIDLRPRPNLKIALAPYHLEEQVEGAAGLASLIRHVGSEMAVFYAWQHGLGCHQKLPKEQELLQLPGRGSLDFQAPIEALREVGFSGFTEIFMHPVPRGIPILPTAAQTTEEINRSRSYLERLL